MQPVGWHRSQALLAALCDGLQGWREAPWQHSACMCMCVFGTQASVYRLLPGGGMELLEVFEDGDVSPCACMYVFGTHTFVHACVCNTRVGVCVCV
jgi:hypothetical protein